MYILFCCCRFLLQSMGNRQCRGHVCCRACHQPCCVCCEEEYVATCGTCRFSKSRRLVWSVVGGCALLASVLIAVLISCGCNCSAGSKAGVIILFCFIGAVGGWLCAPFYLKYLAKEECDVKCAKCHHGKHYHIGIPCTSDECQGSWFQRNGPGPLPRGEWN